ncbi:MAG: NifU family protein [Deltaproteobacteria bacterium]|nr:NifU family protein [Deltaproteobacteria bacterium]
MNQAAAEHRVRDLVQNVLAPLVAKDGGKLVFDRIEGTTVHVQLSAACAGCPGRALTIELLLLPAMKLELPELTAVLASTSFEDT